MKRYYPLLFFVAMLLIFDLAYSLLSTCQEVYPAATKRSIYQNGCTAFGGVVPLVVGIALSPLVNFLETYEHSLIAGFTIVLAFSTIGLWWSTSKLWNSTNDAVRLAREEFIATHRPKIKFHVAEITRKPPIIKTDEADEWDRIGASILCFNIGESVAKNVEVRGQIFAGANFAVDVARPIVKAFPEVLSGQKLRAEMDSDIPVVMVAASQRQGIDYHCLGWVAYWDENGLRRETGFCLRADFGKHGDRWISAGKPEYEYDY